MLKDLDLQLVYDSSEYDLVKDLQVPLLEHSNYYLRGVGFFSSGWLGIASSGIAGLALNGGKAQIIMSPVLSRKDWEALQFGQEAKLDETLKSLLATRIDDLKTSLETDTLNALAWLIADGLLEIRFAIPRQIGYPGNYHDKVGVFRDGNGDSVVIHGSLNDSIQGSLNGESFSVFRSWEEGQEPYLRKHFARLESLWNDGNQQFRVHKLPDAIREKMVELRSSKERPYLIPSRNVEYVPIIKLSVPLALHTYQEQAIDSWKKAGHRGVFEMATGTGKTITSLAAAVDVYHENGRIALIILVPYKHLLDQWSQNVIEFGFNPILCSGDHGKWQIEVKSKIQDLNIGAIQNICIISVQMTAASERFQESIEKLDPSYTMIIGDEVHYLGANYLRKALTEKAQLRLGLSATPRRWFDQEGTSSIFDYFGEVCFEYPLEKAIGTYLTPYKYFPNLIELTDEEIQEFAVLTQKIVQMSHVNNFDDSKSDALKILLQKRSMIISSAHNKIPVLLELLKKTRDEDSQKGKPTRDILIYCAPGKHKAVLKEVAKLGFKAHEFVHDVSLHDREKILGQFKDGEIQVLVAIRCLDEGVDVPSTKIVFIMSSTTNPRQFIQRRGRILRLSEGKTFAVIHDFFVSPTLDQQENFREISKIILQREMPRFTEFASCSLNEFEARSEIWDTLKRMGMIHLLNEKPWDIFHTLGGEEKEVNAN